MMADREADSPEVTRRKFLTLAAAGGSLAALARLGGWYGLAARTLATAEAAPAPVLKLTTDLGVPASASIDVTGAITQALAGLPLSATVLLQGFYRTDRAVILQGLRNLRIVQGTNPSGFVRFTQAQKPPNWPRKTPWASYLDLRDCEGVLLEGFSIRGPLASPTYSRTFEEAAGVSISGTSTGVTLRGLSISGVHGDFVIVAEDRQHQPTGIVVEDTTGDTAGRQMIADVGGRGLTVRRCTFKNSGRSGIDIEPSTPLGSHNITIEDSTFENPSLYCLAGGDVTPHRNIVVRRTKFFGGKGLAKYGPPEGAPPGSHQGLVLEDVTYEWRPTPGVGKIVIARTDGIQITRVNARFRGEPGSIEGTGEVRNSVFTSNSLPPSVPVVYLCGVTDISNVGTGPCQLAR